jgi:ABC-type lipoprotein export system ATPase subunit
MVDRGATGATGQSKEGFLLATETQAAAAQPRARDERPFIICDNLVKIYKVADLEAVALQGLDLNIRRGELMAIIGNSGSGKSTLLNILGGLDRPSAGRVTVDGRDLLKLSEAQLVQYKRDVVGFIWQQTARNMLPYLTALENVELPMVIAGRANKKGRQWALEMLEAVGLGDRTKHKLGQLSGGEQQRVAIAIGMANNPPLLLADEPTGSVDGRTAVTIFDIFHQVRSTYGTTIVIVTHDPKVMSKVDRVVAIRDGKTSSETVRRIALDLSDFAEANMVLGETHDEFIVLDAAGRLQIPREYLEKLEIRGKVRLEMAGDEIVIRRSGEADEAQGEESMSGPTAKAGAEAHSRGRFRLPIKVPFGGRGKDGRSKGGDN